jgi:hypothetical protein
MDVSFLPSLSLLSFFSLLSLSRLSTLPLPPALSVSLPTFVQSRLIPEAGPHRPQRLLITLNRIDFVLTPFIDYVRNFRIF